MLLRRMCFEIVTRNVAAAAPMLIHSNLSLHSSRTNYLTTSAGMPYVAYECDAGNVLILGDGP
jgi:hypothetical protein